MERNTTPLAISLDYLANLSRMSADGLTLAQAAEAHRKIVTAQRAIHDCIHIFDRSREDGDQAAVPVEEQLVSQRAVRLNNAKF